MSTEYVPLERRLREYEGSSEVIDILKHAVSGPYVNPQDVRRAIGKDKYDLAKSIVTGMHGLGLSSDTTKHPDFVLNLYREINEEPLYRVCYGLNSLRVGNNKVVEVLNKLTDYEKVYFLAGVWCKRPKEERIVEGSPDKNFNPNGYTNFALIVSDYIVAGVDFIKSKYADDVKAKLKLPEVEGKGGIEETYQRLRLQNQMALSSPETHHRNDRGHWWDN